MKKKLKIAYFLDNFFPQLNGVVTSSINTAVEIARRGHEVFGVVPEPETFHDYPGDYFPYPIEFHKGHQAAFYPDFKFTNPFSRRIVKSMKAFKPDLIHFHAPFTLGYVAIRMARRLRIPVVGTFHTFFAEPEYLSLIGKEDSIFLQKFGWWYSNQFFNRCDAVVSPGKATARIIKGKKLQNKVHIISNGVEAGKYTNFKFNKKQFPLEVKKGEEWLLYIGRVSHEKGLDVLTEAVSHVMTRRDSVRLLVVGDGPYLDIMKNKVRDMNLEDKFFFSGMIPNKDLLESGILKHMKLFVTASTSENQPMTILESIMFGLPIVGVDAKGIPELVEGNGFIVPPSNPQAMADKLILLLEDKKLHKKMSNKSTELLPRHDIVNTTDEMEELYTKLISRFNAKK